MRAWWLVLLGLAWPAATAAAEPPRVHADVVGRCPDAAQVAHELPAGLVDGEGGWTLRVRREKAGVRVELSAATGERPLVRVLAGEDCAALAAAIGAIVEGHFLELGELTEPVLAIEAPPVEAEPPDLDPVPQAEPPAAKAPPVAPPPAAPPPVAPAAPARFGLGLSAAMAVDQPGDGSAEAGASLDFTWVRGDARWRWRGQLTTIAAHTLDGPDDDLAGARRAPLTLRVDVGKRLGAGPLWLQPAAGAALVVSDVSSDGATHVMRAHPAAALSLAAGVRLGAGVSLRVEGTGLVFPVRDRYFDAMGERGHSPRTTLTLGLGLDVALGSEKD